MVDDWENNPERQGKFGAVRGRGDGVKPKLSID